MAVTTKVPTKVQKRSGFSKSHHNALSQKVGTAVPILTDEVIPNTKVYLRYAMAGSMPPMATDTYLKCYYDIRAFFVPFRLLYGGFESWFSDYEYPVVQYGTTDNKIVRMKAEMPVVSLPSTFDKSCFQRGTLADYLGFCVDFVNWDGDVDTNVVFTPLPFLAYHRVMNDWFRQSNITQEYFARPSGYSNQPLNSAYAAAFCPFVSLNGNQQFMTGVNDKDDLLFKLADGVSLFDLRQVNYDYDYFTNALPNAQNGAIPMSVASAANFTIPALRVANSLQQFSELNALAGSSLVDVVKARYGANLSRGVAQRCVYLGGARLDIGTKGVDVTANAGSINSQNPFKNQLGAAGGKVYVQGTDVIIDGFTAEEPGYIMVIGAVIPKATYANGIRRYLKHYIASGSITDMANPLLQNVGNQPIYDYEITGSIGVSSSENLIFGYTDRYAEFMTIEDGAHGLLAAAEPLSSFLAQRYFRVTDNPVIGTNFLEVNEADLDGITAVYASLRSYGFYGQFAFDYKVSQPLAQYSLPSLQNPAYEHGKTVIVHRGGFRF